MPTALVCLLPLPTTKLFFESAKLISSIFIILSSTIMFMLRFFKVEVEVILTLFAFKKLQHLLGSAYLIQSLI